MSDNEEDTLKPDQGHEDSSEIPEDDAKAMLKQLADTESPVLVQVVEWHEWIPAQSVELMEGKEFNFHNGITGFVSGKDARLIDIGITGTQLHKVVEVEDKETGDKHKEMWTCYVFQAILAQNIKANVLKSLLKVQEPPEMPQQQGRDRRKDLTIIEGSGSNRKSRRDNKKGRH